MQPLSRDVLSQLFTGARTFNHWLDKPVREQQLRELWDLAKWGPTSMNCLPMRLVFVVSDQAKRQLEPALARGNVEQTMTAPVTAIVATDHAFYEKLPELFPPNPKARDIFAGNPELAAENAFRNACLQGGYLILAARALGLDCGPMSGFDAEKVDRTFFPDGRVKTNFLLNIGYGDREKLHPRGPRPEFGEVASIR